MMQAQPAGLVPCRELCRNLFFAVVLISGLNRLEAQTPEIVVLTKPTLWQRAEFQVNHAPVAANRFDPDQIRLDATFTAPSGRSLTVPAFWYQDFSRALSNDTEVLTPVGVPQWRIRFTPTEPGDYTLSLSVATNDMSAGKPVMTHFSVPPDLSPGRHGYVRIAPDRRYFETADGRPLHLIGENVCWAGGPGTYDYDIWFGGMKKAGENFARLWMSPWFAGIEHKADRLDHYDLRSAWQLDYIFQEAEQDNIYLMLCFDHHGMFQTDNKNWGGSNNFWKINAYNIVNGGPCVKPNDFFTSAKARAIYQKRLRYLIGRYGYSPHLLAWQFFNEIDNVYGPLNADDVLAWHRLMGQWLHTHDPYHHLVTTSLTGGSERPEIWSLPEMDFSSYHSYYDPAPGKTIAAFAQSFVKKYGKPMLIGEFGVDARSWNFASDPHLRGFRQALWGGALGGSVGTAMPWWWQDMNTNDVYPLYSALHRILNAAGWQNGTWMPVEFVGNGEEPAGLGQGIADAKPFNARVALNSAWRMEPRLRDEAAVADELAAERASECLSAYVGGREGLNGQRPLKLAAVLGEKAKLDLQVKMAYSGAELIVQVDGIEMLHTNFSGIVTVPYQPQGVNRDFAVALPSGKHVIELVNSAKTDWFLLDSLKLEQVLPAEFSGDWKFAPESVGLRIANKAVLYVYSPRVVFPAGALSDNPPLETGQKVQLADWPAGKFSIRWFDPSTAKAVGTTESTTTGGKICLLLPPFRDDLAAIVVPAERASSGE